tara:strand:- start:2695 stop:4278 length:1584 start_codon:yes stop_codon:yes gene_type:complete
MAFKKLKGGPKMYRKNKDKAPTEMASPAKNYKNPQDYKVFNMGNKPTPVEMGKDYGGPKMGKDYGGPNMNYDGLKMYGKHDGPKMHEKYDGPKMKTEKPGDTGEDPRGPQMASPVKGYKSAAQRKAVHASKADGGKGNPNNPKMYKESGPNMYKDSEGGPKMKSGFKMRSGSPFQRNFGIGASPVKAEEPAKPDYIDIDGDGNKEESMKEAAADKKDNEAGGPQMQSPVKDTKMSPDNGSAMEADKRHKSSVKHDASGRHTPVQMQSPMKRVGEFIDILDEEGNVKGTKRVTEGMEKGRAGSVKDTKGKKFYTQAEKNIQKQIDEGTINPEEDEMISSDAAVYGSEGQYKKQRRLTGIDLKMEKLRNLKMSVEDKGESFEEYKNTPEYKSKLKEINDEYEQYKKDNPDTWKQDLAIYQSRTGQDYDYSEIPKSRKSDGSVEYSKTFDEALEADLGKGEVATRKFQANTLGELNPNQFPPGHPLHDKVVVEPEKNPEYTYEAEGIGGSTFTAGGGGDRRRESDLESVE